MERAWLAIGSVVTVAALAWGTFSVVGVLAHETEVRRATFDAAGIGLVDISNANGTIEVQAGDVDEITLVAEIDHGLRRTRHRAEAQGSTLVVSGSCPHLTTWCQMDYRLVVPPEVDVIAEVGNGRLAIRDLEGDVEADGGNGRIELDRLAGDVRADTANGSIEARGLRSGSVLADTNNGSVRLAFAEAPTSVTATTNNGSVEVVVPDGPEAYRVQADTNNGRTDLSVRTDPGSNRSIDARTNNGSVTVRPATG